MRIIANNTGFETISVASNAVSTTSTTLSALSRSAIFYIDPDSNGIVRYRADETDPTTSYGLPLRPGRSIVVVGDRNVRNSKFITESGSAKVHCLYYDQVDVVDLGIASSEADASSVTELQKVRGLLEEATHVLKQIRNATGEIAFDTTGDKVPSDD